VFERRLAVPPWQRLATAGHVAARSAGANLTEALASWRPSTPTPHS
jgi:hypothetical protein